MKVTKSLRERLFVMHLDRELEFQRMKGETPNMIHAVNVANSNTKFTVETIEAEEL